MTVWKTEISAVEHQITVHVPKGSKFLAAKSQHNRIAIWYTVPDTHALLVNREFLIVSTDQDVDVKQETLKYWGTVQEEGYVLHVFEILSESDE